MPIPSNTSLTISSQEIRTQSSARVTSITSDQVQGDYICAGFADGTVRIYDQRVDRMKALVRTWREHEQPIIKIHMQRGGLRELVSCSSDGIVKHWDATQEASIHTVRTTKDRATSMSVHEHAPVVAVYVPIPNLSPPSVYAKLTRSDSQGHNPPQDPRLQHRRRCALDIRTPCCVARTDAHEPDQHDYISSA